MVGQQVVNQQKRWMIKKGRKATNFQVGDMVYGQSFHGEKWKVGTICRKKGDVNFEIEWRDGSVAHRHADQIRLRYPSGSELDVGEDLENPPELETTPEPTIPITLEPTIEETPEGIDRDSGEKSQSYCPSVPLIEEAVLRRSGRERRRPVRFEGYET